MVSWRSWPVATSRTQRFQSQMKRALLPSGDIDAGVECAEGFTVFPGLGALVGLAVDAVIPGRIRVIYEASGAAQSGRPSVSIAPMVSSRAKGVAVSFAF